MMLAGRGSQRPVTAVTDKPTTFVQRSRIPQHWPVCSRLSAGGRNAFWQGGNTVFSCGLLISLAFLREGKRTAQKSEATRDFNRGGLGGT